MPLQVTSLFASKFEPHQERRKTVSRSIGVRVAALHLLHRCWTSIAAQVCSFSRCRPYLCLFLILSDPCAVFRYPFKYVNFQDGSSRHAEESGPFDLICCLFVCLFVCLLFVCLLVAWLLLFVCCLLTTEKAEVEAVKSATELDLALKSAAELEREAARVAKEEVKKAATGKVITRKQQLN